MPIRRRAVLAALPSLPSLPGLVALPALARAGVLVGSGTARVERRAPGDFEALAVSLAADVDARPSERPYVEVRADDNLLAAIVTRVRDGTLQVEVDEGVRLEPSARIVVEVGFTSLSAVSLAGSGRLDAAGVRSRRFRASLGGSGRIGLAGVDLGELDCSLGGSGALVASGRTARLSVEVGGSGRVDAEQLLADDVAVQIAGHGSARVHAERRLRVSIAGSGDVVHSGRAVPDVTLVGSGRVRRA